MKENRAPNFSQVNLTQPLIQKSFGNQMIMSDNSREYYRSGDGSFMEPHSIEKVLGINTNTSG